MDSQQQAPSYKAALLLSRALLAHILDDPFKLAENGVFYDQKSGLFIYEDKILNTMDMCRGALVLLRQMVLDLSEAIEIDEIDIARILELSIAVQDTLVASGVELDGPIEE